MPISEINWSRDTLNNTPIVTGWVGTQSQVPAPQGVGALYYTTWPPRRPFVCISLALISTRAPIPGPIPAALSRLPWAVCGILKQKGHLVYLARWDRGPLQGYCLRGWQLQCWLQRNLKPSGALPLPLWFSLGQNGVNTPPPPPYRDKVSYALAMISQSLGNGRGPVPPAECWTWRGGILHALGDGRDPWPCWTVAPSQCRSYFVCLTALPAGLGAPSHSVGIWELMERSHLCQAFEGCVAIN